MASISVGTLTVNAAFFQEIKEVNQGLWRLLAETRSLCERPSRILSRPRNFHAKLEELRDQLALHFALEEAYGYFEDPVHVAPQLCERAYALRAEHRQLYVQICDLVDRAVELQTRESRGELAAEVTSDFDRFDRQLKRHESAENELIFQEYDDDIGVGD